MKKTFLLSTALLALSISFATNQVTVKPALKASEVFIPIDNSGKMISLLDLSQMSIKEVQAYTGKKMSFTDRLTFKAAQKQLKSYIRKDGTIDNKRMAKYLNKKDVTSGFHLGGFALGLLLSIIGVLIAYLINDDKKAARVKWAWIGFGISLVIWLIFAIA